MIQIILIRNKPGARILNSPLIILPYEYPSMKKK